MVQLQSEVVEEIQKDITPPKGWEMQESAVDPTNVQELQSAYKLKQKIGRQFPFIANTVEEYIDNVFGSHDILISEALIAIDADATFHILLLVTQDDYFSPQLHAAKIKAKEVLTTIGNVSMRYKFTIAEEYFKSYYTQLQDKLRYSFKNDAVLSLSY